MHLVYANSFLATLNLRKHIHWGVNDASAIHVSIPLTFISPSSGDEVLHTGRGHSPEKPAISTTWRCLTANSKTQHRSSHFIWLDHRPGTFCLFFLCLWYKPAWMFKHLSMETPPNPAFCRLHDTYPQSSHYGHGWFIIVIGSSGLLCQCDVSDKNKFRVLL